MINTGTAQIPMGGGFFSTGFMVGGVLTPTLAALLCAHPGYVGVCLGTGAGLRMVQRIVGQVVSYLSWPCGGFE